MKRNWEPERLVPVELREAIHDKKLPPDKKALVVYKSSVELRGKLFADSKTENIREAKQVLWYTRDMSKRSGIIAILIVIYSV